jgi:adenosylcobinamide-phosphate synthase
MSKRPATPGAKKTLRFLLIIPDALLLDVLLGEPPDRYHPVVWMGNAISALRRHAPKRGRLAPLCYGGGVALGGASAAAGAGWLLQRICRRLPFPFDTLITAWLLKTTFSARGLARAAGEVNAALQRDDLPEARRLLAWHLVSRDTHGLSQAHVCAATIESVAENLSDSIVAPLFYYAVGGLPAALAYRYINTGDAMLGYHDAEREWLGKIPARLDDVVNLIPARLSAFALLLAAGRDAPRGWRIWRRDHCKTASPNAGQPMSMMAGILGVELEKIGHYQLGAGLRPPSPRDVTRSIHLMKLAAGLAVMGGLALSLLKHNLRTTRSNRP